MACEEDTEHRNLFQKVSFIQENLWVPSSGILLNSGEVIITEITDTTPELSVGKIRVGGSGFTTLYRQLSRGSIFRARLKS